MISSGSFAVSQPSDKTSGYNSGAKYTGALLNIIRRRIPNTLNIISPYVLEPSISKKLTGKKSSKIKPYRGVTVGLNSIEKMEQAGFKNGSYVIGQSLT